MARAHRHYFPAVGDEGYLMETKRKLSAMAVGREIVPKGSAYALRERAVPYGTHFDAENSDFRPNNTFFLETLHDNSGS